MTEGTSVSISSIVTGSICPLRLYYEQTSPRPAETREYPHYTICKQISYHLGTSLDLSRIWDECRAVDPDLNSHYMEFLETCVKNCTRQNWRIASETDVFVSSERYGIYGSIDRLFDNQPYFSLTRASHAPSAGVYRQDRLRILCYALCLEEFINKPVKGGIIEYIPDGIGRHYTIQPRDKREFIQAHKKSIEVISGKIPPKPFHPPCTRCRFEVQCLKGVRRLSDIMDRD